MHRQIRLDEVGLEKHECRHKNQQRRPAAAKAPQAGQTTVTGLLFFSSTWAVPSDAHAIPLSYMPSRLALSHALHSASVVDAKFLRYCAMVFGNGQGVLAKFRLPKRLRATDCSP